MEEVDEGFALAALIDINDKLDRILELILAA